MATSVTNNMQPCAWKYEKVITHNNEMSDTLFT